MIIKNDVELRSVLVNALRNAMGSIMHDVLSLLHTEIAEIVYEGYSPNFYERTYEFMNAWETKIESMSEGGHGEIYFEPNNLSFNEESFQHGSYLWGSSASYLADIIFQGMIGSAFGFPQLGARDAWSQTEKLLGKSKSSELGSIFKRAMAEQGFVVK